MKIAYIITSLANAGPIAVVRDLVSLMKAHGHDVDVYYFDPTKELTFACDTRKISMLSNFDFAKYDIVHCHGLRPDLYVMIHKGWKCKTPICTTIHSYMEQDHAFKYGKKWAKITTRMVLFSTVRDDRIILLSRHMRDYYKNKLPSGKLTYAYNTHVTDSNAMLTDEESQLIGTFKGVDRLLCSVSGLNRRKGLHQIIRVLPFLPNVKFCVVGDGEERQNLQQLADSLDVRDKVLFVGYKDNGFRFLTMADAFVMPSYSEGFPLAMLEAASMGKAIVCSDIPVFDEVFSDTEVSRFKNDDADSLKMAVERAILEKGILGENAKARFDKDYSAENFYNRHIEIYNDMIYSKRNNSNM